MAFWEAGLGGSLGGQHRVRVQADLLGQEAGNNRSLMRFHAWFERVAGGSRVWNYNACPFTVNRNGAVRNGSITYDSRTAGQRWYFSQNEDHWVGHDGNGNAAPYYAAAFNASNSPYLTSGTAGGNTGLPTINRFTNITQFYTTNVTDVGFRIEVAVDAMANFLQYSLEDGVGWRDQFGGDFYNYGFNVGGNFPSNRTYNLRVRVRRADSGLWTESGVISVTTADQGGFVDVSGV